MHAALNEIMRNKILLYIGTTFKNISNIIEILYTISVFYSNDPIPRIMDHGLYKIEKYSKNEGYQRKNIVYHIKCHIPS